MYLLNLEQGWLRYFVECLIGESFTDYRYDAVSQYAYRSNKSSMKYVDVKITWKDGKGNIQGTVFCENKIWSPVHGSKNEDGEFESQLKVYSDELEKGGYGLRRGIFLIAPHLIDEKNLKPTTKIKFASSKTWYKISVWLRKYIRDNDSSEVFVSLTNEFILFLKEKGIIMPENFNIDEMSAASHAIPLLNKCWSVLENVHSHIENELKLGKSMNSFGPWINEGRLAGDPRFSVYGEAEGRTHSLRVFAGFFFDNKRFSSATESLKERDYIVPTLRVIVSFDPKFTDKFTPLLKALNKFQKNRNEWVIRKGDWYCLTIEKLMTDYLNKEEQQLEMIDFFKDRLNEIKDTKIDNKYTLLDYISEEKGMVTE